MGKVIYIKDRTKVIVKGVTTVTWDSDLGLLPRHADGTPDFFRWIIHNLEKKNADT